MGEGIAKDTSGVTIGSVGSDGTVYDSSHGTLGTISGDTIKDASGTTTGYVRSDGTITDASGVKIGEVRRSNEEGNGGGLGFLRLYMAFINSISALIAYVVKIALFIGYYIALPTMVCVVISAFFFNFMPATASFLILLLSSFVILYGALARMLDRNCRSLDLKTSLKGKIAFDPAAIFSFRAGFAFTVAYPREIRKVIPRKIRVHSYLSLLYAIIPMVITIFLFENVFIKFDRFIYSGIAIFTYATTLYLLNEIIYLKNKKVIRASIDGYRPPNSLKERREIVKQESAKDFAETSDVAIKTRFILSIIFSVLTFIGGIIIFTPIVKNSNSISIGMLVIALAISSIIISCWQIIKKAGKPSVVFSFLIFCLALLGIFSNI